MDIVEITECEIPQKKKMYSTNTGGTSLLTIISYTILFIFVSLIILFVVFCIIGVTTGSKISLEIGLIFGAGFALMLFLILLMLDMISITSPFRSSVNFMQFSS